MSEKSPIIGEEAESPEEIPRRGWGQVLWRVIRKAGGYNLSMAAAGCSFYALMAIFPAMIAVVTLYGLVADPTDVEAQISDLAELVPGQAYSVIKQQLETLVTADRGGLGWGLAVSLAISIWSATRGIKSLFAALNVAYGEEERRGFFQLNAIALLFTAGAVLAVLLFLAVIVGAPAALAFAGLGRATAILIDLLRWPLVAGAMIVSLGLLYRYGASRRAPRRVWVSWGAVVATALWIAASVGFSVYVANFGSYDATYGSVGAVIILLLWFHLSALLVLVGAVLNAELEHQTARDSTVGRPRPMGRRGAFVADTRPEAGR